MGFTRKSLVKVNRRKRKRSEIDTTTMKRVAKSVGDWTQRCECGRVENLFSGGQAAAGLVAIKIVVMDGETERTKIFHRGSHEQEITTRRTKLTSARPNSK